MVYGSLFIQMKIPLKWIRSLIDDRWQNIHISGGVLCVLINISNLADKRRETRNHWPPIGNHEHLIYLQDGISAKSKQSSHKEHGRRFL